MLIVHYIGLSATLLYKSEHVSDAIAPIIDVLPKCCETEKYNYLFFCHRIEDGKSVLSDISRLLWFCLE